MSDKETGERIPSPSILSGQSAPGTQAQQAGHDPEQTERHLDPGQDQDPSAAFTAKHRPSRGTSLHHSSLTTCITVTVTGNNIPLMDEKLWAWLGCLRGQVCGTFKGSLVIPLEEPLKDKMLETSKQFQTNF